MTAYCLPDELYYDLIDELLIEEPEVIANALIALCSIAGPLLTSVSASTGARKPEILQGIARSIQGSLL